MMKKAFIGLFSLALAIATGRLDAASGSSVSVLDWFGVSFENCPVGSSLAPTSGVHQIGGLPSGSWVNISAADCFFDKHLDDTVLTVDLPDFAVSGPAFLAAREPSGASMDGYRIDCTVRLPALEEFPSLPDGTKSAMAIVVDGGETNFYGYCRAGWVRISSPKVSAVPNAYYEQRAEFANLNGTRVVTYSIKANGEYVALSDDSENPQLQIAAASPVKELEFRGTVDVVAIDGVETRTKASPEDVGPKGYPMVVNDWFSVLMQTATTGEKLDTYTGVLKILGDYSGEWTVPETSRFSAAVGEEDGERYLCVQAYGDDPFVEHPTFSAMRENTGKFAEIEFSMRFFNDGAALAGTLPEGTKAALTIADVKGVPCFHGYTKKGWVALSAEGVWARYLTWYDLMAAFETDDAGVLYVSYYVKTTLGFTKLLDEKGNGLLPVAGSGEMPVQFVDLFGDADVKFLNGTELKADPTRAYYWIGADGADMNVGTNWSHTAGGVPCPVDDVPRAESSMIFETPAIVSVSRNMEISNIVVNANVSIRGSQDVRSLYDGDGKVNGLGGDQLRFSGIYGAGKLTIESIVLYAQQDAAAVECPLCVSEKASGLYCEGRNLAVRGNLSGSGALIAYQHDGSRGVTFAGENSAYGGVYTETVNGNEDLGLTRFASGAASFPNAMVCRPFASTNDRPEAAFAPFGAAGDIYEFGAYTGRLVTAEAQPTVIIGGLGTDCEIFGQMSRDRKDESHFWKATLIKVGEGLLTVRSTNVGDLEIREGAVAFETPAAMYDDPPGMISFAGGELVAASFDPSPFIRHSSGAIVFDDKDVNHVWRATLDSSNVGGLVKRGAGELRLGAVPKYAGPTIVEDGTLVLPFGAALGEVLIADKASAQFFVDLAGVTDDDALLFSATSARGLPNADVLFINVPAGFVIPEPIVTPEGGVLYLRGMKHYRWTGKADDGAHWSTPGNWLADGVTATTLPGPYDIVEIDNGTDQILVDVAASVWMLTCSEKVRPFKFVSPPISNATYATDNTSLLKVGVGSTLPQFFGVGGLATADPLEVTVAEGETSSFVGSISAVSLTKSGSGELMLAGANAFGSLALEGGVLRLGSHLDIDGVRMDFDASRSDLMTVDDAGLLSQWKSTVGNEVFTYHGGSYAKLTRECFGGATTVRMRPEGTIEYFSRYRLTPTNTDSKRASKSVFLLYHADRVANDAYLYGEKTATGAMRINGDGASHCWVDSVSRSAAGFFTGLEATSAVIADDADYLTSWIDTPFHTSDATEYLGTVDSNTGFRGSIAEIVTYTNSLSHPERQAVQRSLMAKWGLGETYEVLPKKANLTMKAGCTLDLGGLSQTVASFAGAGIVKNGLLMTTDGKVSATGDLTIPAADGTVYCLPGRNSILQITDGTAKGAIIVVPDDCMSASVFFEGNVTWRKANDAITISGPSDGWYTISNTGGGACIIIR